MRRWIIGFFILVALPTGVISVCSGSTCEACIFSDPSCGWCSQKGFTSERCQAYSSLLSAGCDRRNIDNPVSTFSKIQDEEVRDSSLSDQAIQVQPQFIRIETRPRKKETFTLRFRAARNYPVDLYFLFDSSLSMETHILSLASLASDIGRSIGNISSNYRMAYGLFQDKVILPYTDTTPLRLEDPCLAITDRNCSPPFEFKHLLDMTKDVRTFEKVVKKLKLTGNIDKPEGSLDAIMQAVTCTEKIGWRKGSRKLLILASNDRFHIAGDGKLAGILVPNDGECHLDTKGDYTMELLQDYPSIGQLTDIVDKKEVHIIFAVTNDQLPLFNELSKRIPHSTVELLAESGSGNKDIRQIIEKKYREMISEVEMIYTPVEGVDIKIKAKSPICERQDSNICKGIEIGDSVDFDVEVRVMSCLAEGGDKKKTVDIYPGSLSTDKLTVEIITECDCDCTTDKTTWEQNSPLCSDGNGTLICGQCVCNQGRFGQNCECDATDTDTVYSGCLDPKNNSTGTECSGSGTCICGVCYCDEGFSGPYCECNDKNCGLFEGKLCAGEDQGRCQCGKCVCDPQFTGDTCGCKNSNISCVSNGKLCSGNGICQCDKCECDTAYSGTYCEKCVLCGDTVCDESQYRECAECALKNQGTTGGSLDGSSEDGLNCSQSCPKTELVDELGDTDAPGVCFAKLSDGCFFTYRVSRISETKVAIEVLKEKKCPTPLNYVPIVVGVVIGVVVLGLIILLLWKLITTYLDKLEYTRFKEDAAKGQWAQNDNPMYKGATTTYRNPMLDMNEVDGN